MKRNMPIWERRSCPLCRNNDSSKEYISSNPRTEDLDFDTVKKFFIGLRHKQIFFTYYRCSNCGVLYNQQYFSDQQLSELYSCMPDNFLGADESTVEKTQSGYVEYIAKYVHSSKIYLELGPDEGIVTENIIKLFSPQTVSLVEPNKEAHPAYQSLRGKIRQLQVVGNLKDSSIVNIDLVVGIHVLDHLIRPYEELSILKDRCIGGAFLAVVVHNEKSLLRKLMSRRWPPFCLQHPTIFNFETLDNLMGIYGWRPVARQRTKNFYNLNHFMSLVLSTLGIRNPKRIPNFIFSLPLGNFLAIYEKV